MSNKIYINKIAKVPKENFQFPTNTCTEFYIIEFHKVFQGLLGMNILKNCEINLKEKFLKNEHGTLPIFFNENDELEYDLKNECEQMHYPEINFSQINQEIRTDHLNEEEKTIVHKIVKRFKNIFYKDGDKLTFTNTVKHSIPTTDDKPVYSRIYRYPEIHKVEVNKQVQEMLEQGVIRPSTSPYSAPVWIVPKKTDASNKIKWRMVIDYRKLNEKTKEDKHPLPNMDDILDKLGRANYFTTLDLAKGFHQIEVEEKSIEKTAFSTPQGHFEFLRMPFGLKNAPATFQRMMNNTLAEFIGKICFVYLDDVIIFSTSLEEHENSLIKILTKLKEVNLQVQLDKTEFLKKETEFLGHIVTTDGIKPNPKKLDAIEKFPLPKTIKEIQGFLGLTGYYRKFIHDYAKIAKPMTIYLKKDKIINTNDKEYNKSFNELKKLISNDPILIYPDFNKTFTLTTDASNFALGAVLSQDKKPICFASRTLNAHEINYSTIEKELLAIVWATKQFRHYLYGRQFIIKTDHRPLVWLSNLKEPNSKMQRWKIKLNEYNFRIDYIKGNENVVADALSRIKITDQENDNDSIAAHDGSNHSLDLQYLTPQVDVNIIECKQCGTQHRDQKNYDTHINSNKHLNIHHVKDKNRQYECYKCNTKFKGAKNLKIHINTKDCEKPLKNYQYKCPDCERTFEKPNYLTKHYKIKHAQNDEIETIHSAEEDSLDQIPISEKAINYFKTQVIIIKGNENKRKIITVHDKKRILYYTKKFIYNHFVNVMIKTCMGEVGIKFPDEETFIEFHRKWINPREIKLSTKSAKIFKCNTLLKDVENQEDALERVAELHEQYNHIGIEKLYEEFKMEYYFPNIKTIISRFINNCTICSQAKHERHPIKIPYKITETPSGPYEHYHIDIWHLNSQEYYLTCIDKFSKFASYKKLENKNFTHIINALEKLFNTMPKPKLITHDNEASMSTLLFKQYLKDKEIATHVTTAHRHTGNSDIERFHETLNEQIRIYKIQEKEQPLLFRINALALSVNIYNKRIHSTTKERPKDIHFGQRNDKLEEIKKKIIETKTKAINYKNNKENRHDQEINPTLVKNTRLFQGNKSVELPRFVKNQNDNHIEVFSKNLDTRRTRYYKDQFPKLKKYQVNKNPIFFSNTADDNNLPNPTKPRTSS